MSQSLPIPHVASIDDPHRPSAALTTAPTRSSIDPHRPSAALTTGPTRSSIAMAALSPIALGGILAMRAGNPSPLLAVPAIVFGVIAATAPALYIATAATGTAPSLAAMMRAFGVAIGAFGIVLAGLVLPSAFLSLSSLSATTTIAVATAALLGAGFIALRRLSAELTTGVARSLSAWLVFGAWSFATIGIAGRLWWDFASEVIS